MQILLPPKALHRPCTGPAPALGATCWVSRAQSRTALWGGSVCHRWTAAITAIEWRAGWAAATTHLPSSGWLAGWLGQGLGIQQGNVAAISVGLRDSEADMDAMPALTP